MPCVGQAVKAKKAAAAKEERMIRQQASDLLAKLQEAELLAEEAVAEVRVLRRVIRHAYSNYFFLVAARGGAVGRGGRCRDAWSVPHDESCSMLRTHDLTFL